MADEPEERIADAAENMAEAEELRAEQDERIADAVVETETTKAAAIVVAAAEASTALANTVAAEAELEAAQKLREKEGDIEWLKENQKSLATQLETSQTASAIQMTALAEMVTKMSETLQSLIPPPLTELSEDGTGIQEVNPVEESLSADEAALEKKEALSAKQKRQRRWI